VAESEDEMIPESGGQNGGTTGDSGSDEVYHHESDNAPRHSHHDEEVLPESRAEQYWRANIRLLLALLAVWFVVSFGFGVLFVDFFNQFSFFGYKLGFWWAQQGSIYVFVCLIFIYVLRIRHIERRFGVDDDE
jgi:putative solute:sodium symporter small subunit